MEKYQFHYDARTYIDNKVARTSEGYTQSEQKQALDMLVRFALEPAHISRTAVAAKLKEVAGIPDPQPADELFFLALQHLAEDGTRQKFDFYDKGRTYIATLGNGVEPRGYSQAEKAAAFGALDTFAREPGLITKARVKAEIAKIDDMDTPGAANVLFAEALEHAQGQHDARHEQSRRGRGTFR